ncbi:MAG: A/G-specific adenine glycosylase, partial [Moraxellaceae bacterium]
GYYARARNLHRCAKTIVEKYKGQFPDTVEELNELTGIGRSTAGAIVSIAYQKRAAILDGNVKRVLARYHAIDGWPGQAETLGRLWQVAESATPQVRCRDYTQAMMDLGAMICTRSRPACNICPLQSGCVAYARSEQHLYPGKKPTKILPVKEVQLVMLRNMAGDIWLKQRPPQGIWGGLWSFPELTMEDDSLAYAESLGAKVSDREIWDAYRHTFSHYHLDITPVLLQIAKTPLGISEGGTLWYSLHQPDAIGLAAPVKKLLEKLAQLDPRR